jgi:hypothetical protein
MSEETVASPVSPTPSESPYTWSIRSDREQERWTLSVPRTTYDDRLLVRYIHQHGRAPSAGEDWRGPGLPEYVRVEASFADSGRIKRTVMKAQFGAGSSETTAIIAPAVFGRRTVSQITIRPAGKWRFWYARLKTPANRLNVVSVGAGTVSAVIIILLSTGLVGQVGQALTGTTLTLAAIAAFLAFCAPILAWLANSLIS